MVPLHVYVWHRPLNLLIPLGCILKKKFDLLSNLKLNGEGKVSTINHINQFNITRHNLKIVWDNEISRLFTLTLEGWIKAWYRTLPTKSIHSWRQFMEVFIIAHENYDYEQLCTEVEGICRNINESMYDFLQRVMQIYYRFPKNDRASDQQVLN